MLARMARSRALLAALLLPAVAAPAAPTDPWSTVAPLLGEWTVDSGGGEPGEVANGGFSFAFDLDRHVVVRRSHVAFDPRPGEKRGATHDDIIVLYPSPDGLRATYWDSEGHVIEYRVRAGEDAVVFESDPASPGPRFRLTYRRTGRDGLSADFAVAPPGGTFQTHVRGTSRRKS